MIMRLGKGLVALEVQVADYYGNPDNDGHFILNVINTSNEVQCIPARSRVAQAIFVKYLTVDDDKATGERIGGIGSTGC